MPKSVKTSEDFEFLTRKQAWLDEIDIHHDQVDGIRRVPVNFTLNDLILCGLFWVVVFVFLMGIHIGVLTSLTPFFGFLIDYPTLMELPIYALIALSIQGLMIYNCPKHSITTDEHHKIPQIHDWLWVDIGSSCLALSWIIYITTTKSAWIMCIQTWLVSHCSSQISAHLILLVLPIVMLGTLLGILKKVYHDASQANDIIFPDPIRSLPHRGAFALMTDVFNIFQFSGARMPIMSLVALLIGILTLLGMQGSLGSTCMHFFWSIAAIMFNIKLVPSDLCIAFTIALTMKLTFLVGSLITTRHDISLPYQIHKAITSTDPYTMTIGLSILILVLMVLMNSSEVTFLGSWTFLGLLVSSVKVLSTFYDAQKDYKTSIIGSIINTPLMLIKLILSIYHSLKDQTITCSNLPSWHPLHWIKAMPPVSPSIAMIITIIILPIVLVHLTIAEVIGFICLVLRWSFKTLVYDFLMIPFIGLCKSIDHINNACQEQTPYHMAFSPSMTYQCYGLITVGIAILISLMEPSMISHLGVILVPCTLVFALYFFYHATKQRPQPEDHLQYSNYAYAKNVYVCGCSLLRDYHILPTHRSTSHNTSLQK